MQIVLYLMGVFLELAILIFFCVYCISLIYSMIRGSFYVPTKQKEIDLFLKEAHLKKGQYFLEIGSGDGRVLRTAALKYGVVGKGIDINPTLNLLANFYRKRKKLNSIVFKKGNIFTADFSEADVIYVFLMPQLIDKIDQRLLKESKKNALIISHAFKIDSLQKYLVKSIKRKPFSTYFYQKK